MDFTKIATYFFALGKQAAASIPARRAERLERRDFKPESVLR
jgi:hypothetical protein